MTNKLKSPTTLILIFLLNAASLSACSAADDVVRLASKAGSQADDAARLASKAGSQADDAARLASKADDAAHLESQAAAHQVRAWTEQAARQYAQEEVNAAIYTYGGLPENFLPDAQERITQKIIYDANSRGIKLSVNAVYASVGGILTATVSSLPARATTPNKEVR